MKKNNAWRANRSIFCTQSNWILLEKFKFKQKTRRNFKSSTIGLTREKVMSNGIKRPLICLIWILSIRLLGNTKTQTNGNSWSCGLQQLNLVLKFRRKKTKGSSSKSTSQTKTRSERMHTSTSISGACPTLRAKPKSRSSASPSPNASTYHRC